MASKFTQKHYEAIAQVIRDYEFQSLTKTGQAREQITLCGVIEDLDIMFNADNPKYDSGRFLTKCGWHPVK